MTFLEQKVASLVQPADAFISCTTEDTIGSVADQLISSHDAILVYDEDDQDRFAGLLVNQTPTGKTPHAHNAKVGNFLKTTPRLSSESTIAAVLAAMTEHRVNLMPLRNSNDEVDGVVEVSSILHQLTESKDLLQSVVANLTPNKPITASMSATTKEVAELMEAKDISRVVLVTDTNAVGGIVSRRDLLSSYVSPSDRQRFSKGGFPPANNSFDEEKKSKGDEPVTAYATTKVETALDTSPLEQVIRPIIESRTASVVLVNDINQPTGFISRRDVLEAITGMQKKESMPVIFKHPDLQPNESDQAELDKVAQVWAKKVANQMPISQIVVSYEITARTSEGKINEIETTVIVDPASGPSSDSLIAKTKARSWLEGLRQAIDNIDRQLQRKS